MSSVIRKWVVLSAVWLVIIVSGTFVYLHVSLDNSFASQNSLVQASDYAYITDNSPNDGLLYQMKGDEITAYFHTQKLLYLKGYSAVQVALLDEEPYVVFKNKFDDNGRIVTEYAVVSFNTDLQPTAISAPFRFDLPLDLTGLSVTEDKVYLTGISDNRRMVYVYDFSLSNMKTIETTGLSGEDLDKWKKDSLNITEILSEGSEGVRYYALANYVDGSLVYRYDNQLSDSSEDIAGVLESFHNKKLSLSLNMILAGINPLVLLIVFLVGIGIIFVVLFFLQNKKRIVYQIASTEAVLLVGFLCLYFLFIANGKSLAKDGYIKWAENSSVSVFDGYELSDLSDSTIYSGADYGVLCDRLMRIAASEYNTQFQTMTADVISSEDTVLLSSDGCNFDRVSEKYGSGASSLMMSAISTSSVRSIWGRYQGKQALYVAVPLSKAGLNGCGVLLVAVTDNEALYDTSANAKMLVLVIILFIIASAISGLFIWVQNQDIVILQDALGKLSRGETEINKPSVIGKDMNYIWNSMFEIQKNILHISREKLLTYETYYKFAPKGVEKILNLPAVTDIHGGEHINRNGTIATLSMSKRSAFGEREKDSISVLYSDLEKCREDYNGLFVSHTNNFERMKYLFLEQDSNVVEFGVEYIQKILQEKGNYFRYASILLCYTPFSYGVVGVKNQASIYMVSPHSDLMDQLSGWFRSMRLPLVITQSVKDHEEPDVSLRYMGFYLPKGGKKEDEIHLYEVLDAYPANIRFTRESTLDDFSEGLRLFYERNFYLARNIFSDILRKAPEDEVSKWYLFECEKYLDEAVPEDYTGSLHME